MKSPAQRALDVLDNYSTDFTVLVEIAGLRKESDFRHVNLSRVDFGAANLDGFDFTGADLRGADLSQAATAGAIFNDAALDGAKIPLTASVLGEQQRSGNADVAFSSAPAPSTEDLTTEAIESDSIAIQIDGDGKSIVVGHPYLQLTRFANRRISALAKRTAINLLQAHARSIELLGRNDELSDLWTWLKDSKAISVRVMVGRAGRGKTRLALELCEDAAAKGWQTGFLTGAELERFAMDQNSADWGWNAPTLAVLDYAAASEVQLNAWLRELSQHEVLMRSKVTPPLRLLLLERQAEPDASGGWWQAVFGGEGAGQAVHRLLDPPEPLVLPALDGVDERRAVMAATLRATGSPLTLPSANEDVGFDRQLSSLTWGGEPLFLMIAALQASQQGIAAVLGLARDDLARSVAQGELARIGRIAKSRNLPEAFAWHMAALATLVGGLPVDDLLDVIDRERTALGYPGVNGATVLSAMSEALPRPGGGIGTVEPDMVGEAVLLLAWEESQGRKGVDVIRRAMADAPESATQVVIRTCQDYAIHGHVAPLTWLDALGTDAARNLPVLLALLNELPEATLELRERAVDLTAIAVAAFRDRIEDSGGQNDEAGLATNLNNPSNRLNAVGRREDALAASEEAVALYRALAATRPDAFRPDLALSLNTLSNSLDAVGRREDALAAIEEAVALYRALAATRPDAFRPDLARTLNSMSNYLGALGRHDEAGCRRGGRGHPSQIGSPSSRRLPARLGHVAHQQVQFSGRAGTA